jgi:hypothetical protein
MAAIAKQKEADLQLLDDSNRTGVSEEDEEEEAQAMVLEGETEGARAMSAAMQISNNLYRATKSMDKCFKRNAQQMAVATAKLATPVPKPARKKTRWDQDDSKDKEDGKEAKPSPFAYVVGENPEVATNSMGKNSVFHTHI